MRMSLFAIKDIASSSCENEKRVSLASRLLMAMEDIKMQKGVRLLNRNRAGGYKFPSQPNVIANYTMRSRMRWSLGV
jgi:hypothetical protein